MIMEEHAPDTILSLMEEMMVVAGAVATLTMVKTTAKDHGDYDDKKYDGKTDFYNGYDDDNNSNDNGNNSVIGTSGGRFLLYHNCY